MIKINDDQFLLSENCLEEGEREREKIILYIEKIIEIRDNIF